jgi:predicted Zn-dependent protease
VTALGDARYAEAAAYFDDVLNRGDGEMRRKTRILAAKSILKSGGDERRAEALLREHTEQEPASVDGWQALAVFYKAKGLSGRATAMYRKVLAVQPGHPEASAEVAAAEGGSPETPPAGLLGRILPRKG